MASMTWKEPYRALACNQRLDILTVAPKTFYYVPTQVSNLTCQEVAPVGLTLTFHKLKTWEAQLESARDFDFCAWIMPVVGSIKNNIETETLIIPRADGSINMALTHHTHSDDLSKSFCFPVNDASWHNHHPGNDVRRDWQTFLDLFFTEKLRLDLSEVREEGTKPCFF